MLRRFVKKVNKIVNFLSLQRSNECMILQEIYLKSFDVFGRNVFSIRDFAGLHAVSVECSKVLLHRLKQNHQVFRVGRGRYVLFSPKHWVVLQGLKRKPRLYGLVLALYELFPSLSLLLLYGSRVRGKADEFSDYDVLLVLEKSGIDALKLKREIERKLKIKLHLTVYSEQAFRIFTFTEPFLKFWFSEGIVFDEKKLSVHFAKPVAKIGYLESMREAKTCLSLSRSGSLVARARNAFAALRISLLVKHALELDYDYGNVNQDLNEELGASLKKIRARKALSGKELRLLERVSKANFCRVCEKLKALGENESDFHWKMAKGVGA